MGVKDLPKTDAISAKESITTKTLEKFKTVKVLCHFFSFRHQRGKAHCPTQNNYNLRSSEIFTFLSDCPP